MKHDTLIGQAHSSRYQSLIGGFAFLPCSYLDKMNQHVIVLIVDLVKKIANYLNMKSFPLSKVGMQHLYQLLIGRFVFAPSHIDRGAPRGQRGRNELLVQPPSYQR